MEYKDAKKRIEASYYLGLYAQTEGRYEDASGWYRVAVKTRLSREGEYRWVSNQLWLWRDGGKTLVRIRRAEVLTYISAGAG